MAIASVCGTLKSGADFSCTAPTRKYAQQISVINKADIESYTITAPTTGAGTACAYNVEFTLKAGTTGFKFLGGQNGSTYKGYVDFSTNETFGTPQFIHSDQMLVAGATEEQKCVKHALIFGKYVVAMQFGDTIEIYGIDNGLSMVDGTLDDQEGGGGTVAVLASREDAPESYLPLVYKSAVPGQEIEDFDDDFAPAP